MVPSFLSQFLLVLATLCPRCLGTECFHARSALPILWHCQDLVNAIAGLARRPGENHLKEWGRRLPTTEQTQSLPKFYYIVGAVLPTTCAVKVDVDRTDSFAVDPFRQSDVAAASERVVGRCLLRQRLIGLDYPSEAGHVYAMIIRTDAPAQMKLSPTHSIQNISLPNLGGILRIVTGDIVIRKGGEPRENSSLGEIYDQ